uniref:Uncharacterized protein n=1 Tax=Eucampia antarctica TaxID=49252 RepID=A0A7S2R0H2_9STRA|mmetsp:Transcript_11372/g.10884  ORF Transcript_11372/g.10884 Transcript_11372/m.10884 type:complete len:142 (+) Transcript_11372:72-497(+)
MNRISHAAQSFHENHEKLKKYIHTAWRYPLPRWGRFVMGSLYFTVPVIGGYQVMQWAIGKAHDSIGENGEKLKIKEIQGLGDKTVIKGEIKKVGADGVGLGVKLAVSDEHYQAQNKQMLQTFFKNQEKRRKRLEKKSRTEE